MKKEVIVAAVIGIVLGFGVTGLLWLKKDGKIKFNFDFLKRKEISPITEQLPTPTTGQEEEEKKEAVQLTIETPENEAIVNEENLAIKGNATPGTTIVIIWEEGEDILITKENGLFETKIKVAGGENLIEISAFDDNGNSASKTLTVIYSTAKF